MLPSKDPVLQLRAKGKHGLKQCLAVCVLAVALSAYGYTFLLNHQTVNVPFRAQEILDKCVALKIPAGPPKDFDSRTVSDRFQPGTKPTLIQNAAIFTGARNGTEVVYGDLFLDRGIVKALGYIPPRLLARGDYNIVDAEGKWVTPGLVDLHSHLGLFAAPSLAGSMSANSQNGPVLPWLRSLDGFNTHDDAFELSISGGITSAQVLPGSGNAIGGQAFFMKLRKTLERSPSSMVIEAPHVFNGSEPEPGSPPRWRHMKQACGENLRRYGTRMDSVWSFRSAYDEARKIKLAQDDFCQKAESSLWNELQGKDYPESLQWEMLVDVLRGRVKISNHCYEAVDLDDLVRITNEFKFHIASFHHAHEAWLVPDVLKRTYGGTPTIAIFANHAGYKRESYRGTEYAARILADNGIPVVMKSDHPVLNSRHLLYEAQQAHYFGLPAHLALAAVTSTPATAAGLSHRIGILREGADADVVLWDTHPLQLGATPINVWIDGIREVPIAVEKGGSGQDVSVGKGKESKAWQEAPDVPNWDREREEAIKWEGLPPLHGDKHRGVVAFENVAELWVSGNGGIIEERLQAAQHTNGTGVVIVEAGKVTCSGSRTSCASLFAGSSHKVNLRGGSISPGLLSYGSGLGTQEISGEPSTGPGESFDPLFGDIPKLAEGSSLSKASDALLFQSRDALKSYRAGVTYAVSALSEHSGPIAGLSAAFRTGAFHAAEEGAIIQEVVALHVSVRRELRKKSPSISSTVAVLRRLLMASEPTEYGSWFNKAAEGDIPLVVDVSSADIMATLLRLKAQVETAKGTRMRMVFSGAAEAHLLAKEIADANVGVILTPARPFPATWDDRRILAGPPITNETSAVKLLKQGVVVGLGVPTADQARNARFDLTWAGLESNGEINKREAYALSSSNLEKLLGVKTEADGDLVAYEGGSCFDLSSKVVGILSAERREVELF